jgi:predicted ATPase
MLQTPRVDHHRLPPEHRRFVKRNAFFPRVQKKFYAVYVQTHINAIIKDLRLLRKRGKVKNEQNLSIILPDFPRNRKYFKSKKKAPLKFAEKY